jgi:hypothetical protein
MVKWGLPQGARVRTRVATTLAPHGAQGCVLGAWPTIPHAYDVRFDGCPETWLMWEDELECVEAEGAMCAQTLAIPSPPS